MRVHWLLYHPQALDDANKGIIDELKKTNYRDIFKEKKEKGEFLEPLGRSFTVFPLRSLCHPRALSVPGPGLSILTSVPLSAFCWGWRGRRFSPLWAEV